MLKNASIIAFYDMMLLLLTFSRPLREARVEEVFEDSRIETFREIEGTEKVILDTDVSLLHARRVLYYRSRDDRKLFSFNVDTRVNTEINTGKEIQSIASFTGIDCNIKAVIYDCTCNYTLNNDNSVSEVNEIHNIYLSEIFPSTSNPKNIKNAAFKYGRSLVKGGNEIDKNELIEFEYYHSVIRIYKDIFLAYDKKTKSWVLVRIIIP